MKALVALVDRLDATSRTSEKLEAIEAYFRETPDSDAAVTLALLLGHRPRRAVPTGLLRDLAVEQSGLPPWLIAECHETVGDFSEMVALVLPETEGSEPEPLHRVYADRILPLVTADDAARAEMIRMAWRRMGRAQRFVYHKLIRGGLRLGVQRRLVARALARVAGVEPGEMAARLAGAFVPDAAAYRAVLNGIDNDPRRPYPFFLARPLEAGPESLGDPGDWLAEWKWDGIRAQLIRREGLTALISRGDEAVTAQFPEIIAEAGRVPTGTVLDGEILFMNADRPAPFAALQRRLNRTKAVEQLSLFDPNQIRFLVYDLLEHGGADQRSRPLSERRAILESLIGGVRTIMPSEIIRAESWDALAALRATSRDRGVEGLMLKRLTSRYGVGRADPTGGDIWWKWKIDPLSIDAVLVAAQPGSGRRATLLTDYTFAVWSAQQGERELIPCAKAYSGLTKDEIERIDAIIRRTTLRRTGPVRHVEPSIVVELGFEGIAPSDRHRSGIALRFPRILRWRQDKPPDEADTLETLRTLASRYGPRTE